MARSKAARPRASAEAQSAFGVDVGPAILPAGDEMPPARMKRNVEGGIIDADRFHDVIRERGQPIRMDGEMVEPVVQASPVEHA